MSKWVQMFDHPDNGTTEFVDADPRRTLIDRLAITSKEASEKMAEAFKEQFGIELPETEDQYLTILYPPDLS